MKNLKFVFGLALLVVVSTACSKKKSSGGAAPVQQNYHLNGGKCYDKNNNQVHISKCDDGYDDGSGPYNDAYHGNECVGYIYYTSCQYNYADKVDCTNNALYAECQDPEGYKKATEIVDCTFRPHSRARYCGGSNNGYY